MKILMVHHRFSPYGGGEAVLMDEAELLEQNGHEVYFFSTDKKPYFRPDYKYSNYFVKYTDFKLSLGSVKNFFKTLYNFEAEKKLDQLIKEIKPDIVHCHHIFYYLTPSVITACKKNNVPVVLTSHESKVMCPSAELLMKNQHLCTDIPCVKGSPIHCLLNRCKNGSLLKSAVVAAESWFNRTFKLFDHVSTFIFPSKALYDVACQSRIPNEKLIVLNNFARDCYFEKEPNFSNNGYLFYVGRLEKIKGVHFLLQAMCKLPQAKLHIAGTGKEEQELKDLATAGEELEKEFKNCLAVMLPTNWFENFPISLIEACVYGKPIIGSNIGGVPELTEHNKNGFLFEPGNVEELTNAIKTLYDDPEMVCEFGKYSREKAEREYTPKVHYDKLMGIYNNAINQLS